jgi:dTDP-4-dehydrorhamnose reductase
MLRLGAERDAVRVVDDQRCTPSYVEDVADALKFLIESSAEGVYHVVNRGSATWYEFATEIFRHRSIGTRLEPITTAEYAAAAPRPAYSVLDTSKYLALGHRPMPDWHVALARYLSAR